MRFIHLAGTVQHQVERHSIAVCPGTIDTARMDVLGREELWQSIVDTIPMKRAASDEEVAGLIAYLCSPSAEYITGQSINIDGGIVMW